MTPGNRYTYIIIDIDIIYREWGAFKIFSSHEGSFTKILKKHWNILCKKAPKNNSQILLKAKLVSYDTKQPVLHLVIYDGV